MPAFRHKPYGKEIETTEAATATTVNKEQSDRKIIHGLPYHRIQFLLMEAVGQKSFDNR